MSLRLCQPQFIAWHIIELVDVLATKPITLLCLPFDEYVYTYINIITYTGILIDYMDKHRSLLNIMHMQSCREKHLLNTIGITVSPLPFFYVCNSHVEIGFGWLSSRWFCNIQEVSVYDEYMFYIDLINKAFVKVPASDIYFAIYFLLILLVSVYADWQPFSDVLLRSCPLIIGTSNQQLGHLHPRMYTSNLP